MHWLRNPRYDLGWLILPTLLVLALYPLDYAPQGVIAAVGLGSLLLSGVHIAANWTLLYRDRTFFRHDKFRYVHMGWLIMLGSVALSAWDLSLFMSLYVYWGLWHFARQHWGIAMLYKAKEKGPRDRFDYLADKVLIHLLLFLPLLMQFARPEAFGFYTIHLYRFDLPQGVADVLFPVWVAALALWLLYSLWRWLVRGTLILPFFLTALTSVVSFACIYFFVDNFLLMYAMISIPHSLQYIGLSLHYHDGKNARLKKWTLPKSKRFRWHFFGFTLFYTVVAMGLVKLNEHLHSPWVYGLLGLTIFHFWVELFSWRPKHNPELRQSLGL
ncbi:MAG TPA: hypothetical protein VFV52_01565 [Bacilli bacterium]|nr:hypothetical protein [Bacilli bacterium]